MSPLLETLVMTALGSIILIGMRLAVYSAAKPSPAPTQVPPVR
jgi:hypothetical protein